MKLSGFLNESSEKKNRMRKIKHTQHVKKMCETEHEVAEYTCVKITCKA